MNARAPHPAGERMRVSLLDQEGPLRVRALPHLVLVPAIACALLGGAALGLWAWAYAVLALVAPLVASLVPTHHARSRDAELAFGAGYVDVLGAGSRTQRIHARAIVGASTAQTARGVLLTLSLARRASPTMIEVEDETQAERIRRALGVGHEGFGTVGWQTERSGAAKAGFAGQAMLAALGVIYALVGASDVALIEILLQGIHFFLVGAALTLHGAISSLRAAPFEPVSMTADGVRLWTPAGPIGLPYGQIHDVRVEPECVAFVGPPGTREVSVPRARRAWGRDGLSDEAGAGLRAQIRSAAARARGLGKQKDDLAGRLELLRRSSGEGARDWLVRLDAAGHMLGAGTGYRGQTLDVHELWAVLEDPDADGELRTAAARVLRSSGQPDARVRIDAAVAATRDEVTNAKMRVAVEREVDEAFRELMIIDAEGPAALRRRAT